MRCSTAVVVLAAVVLVQADETKAVQLSFASAKVGEVPKGWSIDRTGKGEGSVWRIVADETAPSKSGRVLAQTAESPGSMYNLCVVDQTSHKDVEVSVAFKAVRGAGDQGGGIVWRYQDSNNYYVTRANPLENNLRLYKVIDGRRTQLATVEKLDMKAGQWHSLRVEHGGAKQEIEVYLNGKKLISQDRETTIEKSGKVGLWTKADAQTHFDDFRVGGK